MKLLKAIVYLICSFLLMVACSFLSSGYLDFFNFAFRGFVSFILFFSIPLALKKHGSFETYNILGSILPPVIFFLTSIWMGDGMSLWYKLTSWLPLFGYGVGFLFARMNSMKKYVVLILSLVIVTVLLTKVIPSIFHNSIFSTFSSQVDIDVDPNRFIGINSDGDTLRVKDLNSEYTVLHYWSTACGACKLEMIDYDKLLSDDLGNDIEIYPIKIDLERDSPNDFLYNFDFSEQRIIPLHCTNGESKSSFSIKTLPTSIVIRNKKQIISIGTFQEAIENISYHK